MVQLCNYYGTDSSNVEHDVILSGWLEPSGFGLGGVVNEVLNFRGVFSEDGTYALTLKLIDRDASDAVIATKTIDITVGEQATEIEAAKEEQLPTEYPKTGSNVYLSLTAFAIVIIVSYIAINRKRR